MSCVVASSGPGSSMTIGAVIVALATCRATRESSTRADVARRASNNSCASSSLPLKLIQAAAPSTRSSVALVPTSKSVRIDRDDRGWSDMACPLCGSLYARPHLRLVDDIAHTAHGPDDAG